MKPLPVAPTPAHAAPVAPLLHVCRDAVDRLALLRLTERDPLVLECIERATGDLLECGASVVRRMREAGRLENHGLRVVDNRGNNQVRVGSR